MTKGFLFDSMIAKAAHLPLSGWGRTRCDFFSIEKDQHYFDLVGEFNGRFPTKFDD